MFELIATIVIAVYLFTMMCLPAIFVAVVGWFVYKLVRDYKDLDDRVS